MAQMGANVAAHRRRRGLTGDELVELCNRGGYPLTRAVLANIEKGRGKSSGPTVAELLVIARALNVAPVRLLADPDEDDTLEVTPGEHMPTWDAWRWIGGGDDQHADLHRRWEQALSRMEDASVRITAGSAPEDGASVPEWLREQERENVEFYRRVMRQEAQTLVEIEQQMRQLGYPVPAHTPTQTAMIKAVTQ